MNQFQKLITVLLVTSNNQMVSLQNIAQSNNITNTTPMEMFFSWTTRRTGEDVPFGLDSISPQNKIFSVFNTSLQDKETNVIDTWKHQSAFNFVPEEWFHKLSKMKNYLDPPLTQSSLKDIKEKESINMQTLVTKRQKSTYRVELPQQPFMPFTVPTTNATKSNTSHDMATIGQTESDTTPTDIYFSWTTRRTSVDIPFGIERIRPQNKNLSVFNTALQDTETNIIDTWKLHNVFNFVPEGWFSELSEMKQNLGSPRTQFQNIKEQENINMQNLVTKKQKGDWRFMGSVDELLPDSIPPRSYPIDIMVPVMPPLQNSDYVNAPHRPPDYIHPIRLDIRLFPPPMYREELPQRPFQLLPPGIPPPYTYNLPFTASMTNATKSNTSCSVHNIVTINQTESDATPMDIIFSGTTRRTKDVIASGTDRISPQKNNLSAFNTSLQDTEINVIDTWKHPSVFSFVPAGWFPNLNEMKQYQDSPQTQPSLQDIKEQENINMQNLITKKRKGMMRLIPLKKGTIGKKIGTLKQVKGQGNFSSLLKTIGTKYS